MRILVGILASTIASALAIIVVFLPPAAMDWLRGGWPELDFLFVAVIAAASALAMTTVAGWPLARRLQRFGHTKAFDFALLGALLGALPFVLFDAYIFWYELVSALPYGVDRLPGRIDYLWRSVPQALELAAMGMWCGLWSALAFRRVVIAPRGLA